MNHIGQLLVIEGQFSNYQELMNISLMEPNLFFTDLGVLCYKIPFEHNYSLTKQHVSLLLSLKQHGIPTTRCYYVSPSAIF